ncbi:hypothetical protein XELAEV_18003344mg [Xenopus laevis]|nr:hypothetical protein XELAEV_18003344mg [Xenopus laevis]
MLDYNMLYISLCTLVNWIGEGLLNSKPESGLSSMVAGQVFVHPLHFKICNIHAHSTGNLHQVKKKNIYFVEHSIGFPTCCVGIFGVLWVPSILQIRFNWP